jgi:hypothetical protein
MNLTDSRYVSSTHFTSIGWSDSINYNSSLFTIHTSKYVDSPKDLGSKIN